MSSDYGSDILSDEICPIGDPQPIQSKCVPNTRPRSPLKPRDVNIPATPPASSQPPMQSRSFKSCIPSSSQPLSQSSSYTSRLQKYGNEQGGRIWRLCRNYRQHTSHNLYLPIRVFRPQPLLSSRPTPTHRAYEASDNARHPLDEPPPLYRFPFDKIMSDMMAGLSRALQLLDEGRLPLARPTPPASQPSMVGPPSTPSRAMLPSSRPNHCTIPSFANRLRPAVHTGKLRDVPEDYLEWMRGSNLAANNPTLRDALDYLARSQTRSAKKTKQSSTKKNTPLNDISLGTGTTNDRYKFQKYGKPILITQTEARKYFGVTRSAHITRVPGRSEYATIYTLKDVYTYA
ncbi:hypothetical protein K458DRAFT_489579 [Lentithecium fluviatile CBS 122367]|uniref:Uncharacterized protein n=1 Tax=Lentithecium fluviatile CBS 122367 TaxID=1168545 RepID=A0A6G1ISK0_9PLEO|nr:hypothetical protein K458DRAFT_489579 [Lentithecium fluviatile CBS 122367]